MAKTYTVVADIDFSECRAEFDAIIKAAKDREVLRKTEYKGMFTMLPDPIKGIESGAVDGVL